MPLLTHHMSYMFTYLRVWVKAMLSRWIPKAQFHTVPDFSRGFWKKTGATEIPRGLVKPFLLCATESVCILDPKCTIYNKFATSWHASGHQSFIERDLIEIRTLSMCSCTPKRKCHAIFKARHQGKKKREVLGRAKLLMAALERGLGGRQFTTRSGV